MARIPPRSVRSSTRAHRPKPYSTRQNEGKAVGRTTRASTAPRDLPAITPKNTSNKKKAATPSSAKNRTTTTAPHKSPPWTRDERIVLHLLHTKYLKAPDIRHQIFNRLFVDFHQSVSLQDGRDKFSLRCQYGDRLKKDRRGCWAGILDESGNEDWQGWRDRIKRAEEEVGIESTEEESEKAAVDSVMDGDEGKEDSELTELTMEDAAVPQTEEEQEDSELTELTMEDAVDPPAEEDQEQEDSELTEFTTDEPLLAQNHAPVAAADEEQEDSELTGFTTDENLPAAADESKVEEDDGMEDSTLTDIVSVEEEEENLEDSTLTELVSGEDEEEVEDNELTELTLEDPIPAVEVDSELTELVSGAEEEEEPPSYDSSADAEFEIIEDDAVANPQAPSTTAAEEHHDSSLTDLTLASSIAQNTSTPHQRPASNTIPVPNTTSALEQPPLPTLHSINLTWASNQPYLDHHIPLPTTSSQPQAGKVHRVLDRNRIGVDYVICDPTTCTTCNISPRPISPDDMHPFVHSVDMKRTKDGDFIFEPQPHVTFDRHWSSMTESWPRKVVYSDGGMRITNVCIYQKCRFRAAEALARRIQRDQ